MEHIMAQPAHWVRSPSERNAEARDRPGPRPRCFQKNYPGPGPGPGIFKKICPTPAPVI